MLKGSLAFVLAFVSLVQVSSPGQSQAVLPVEHRPSFVRGWTRLGRAGADTMENAKVCPSPDPSIAVSGNNGSHFMEARGCGTVITDWGGGTLRVATHQLIFWGGGHSNYGGNEIYAVNFATVPATFERLNNPTLPGTGQCADFATSAAGACVAGLPPANPTGSCSESRSPTGPNSRHSYGGIAYIPAGQGGLPAGHDGLFVYGGSRACGAGDFGSDAWLYDFATATWMRKDPFRGGSPGGDAGIVVQWDSKRRVVYIFQASNFGEYNPASNTWKVLNDTPLGTHFFGAIDVAADKFILAGERTIREISLSSGAISPAYADASCAAILSAPAPGATYDANARKVVFWPDAGDTLYLYDSATHTCTSETYSHGPANSHHSDGGCSPLPGGGSSCGTFGRFQYVPGENYFVLLNDWNLPAMVLCRNAKGC